MWTKIFFIGLAFICLVSGSTVPFINKCKMEDKNCLKESTNMAIPIFAAGLPEYGVNTVDPLFFKEVDMSSGNLKMFVRNATLTGLKGCKARRVDLEENKLVVQMFCDVVCTGEYEMSGQLLAIPIAGSGKLFLNAKSIMLYAESEIADKVGSDGKTHINIKKSKHSFELKKKAGLMFENLFQGNEVLGRVARELVESSPNEIFNEVAPPLVKVVVKTVNTQIENFFKNVPKEDLVN